jgi:hypothetical protein
MSDQTEYYIEYLRAKGEDDIADDLAILNRYRAEMDKMMEILKDTETPFENSYDGEFRFNGIEELEDLAEDYKKGKQESTPLFTKN